MNKEFNSAMFKKSQKGFSKLEIMTVAVVAGVLMSMAVPAWQSTMRNYRLSSSASILVGALDMARAMSVSRKASYRVLLTNDTIQFIDVEDPGNPPRTPFFLEDGVQIDSPGAMVTFFPAGPASAAVFDLKDESGKTRSVRVRSSGKIAVVEQAAEEEVLDEY